MKRDRKGSAGFTLVELIVVIGILGILAGITVPVYSGYIDKAGEAADLQLLGALNTAYAAACADMGLDPTQVVGAATLSGGAGGRTLTGITTVGTGVAQLSAGGKTGSAALYDAFLRYYGDNISTPFKVYTSLGYDSKNGVFVDGAKTYTYTAADGTKVTLTYADLTNYLTSNLARVQVAELMDEINNVVNGAAEVGGGVAEKIAALFTAKELEELGIDPGDENYRTELANALVLKVAEDSKNMDAEDFVSKLRSAMDSENPLEEIILESNKQGGNYDNGKVAASAAAMYGIATAFAKSLDGDTLITHSVFDEENNVSNTTSTVSELYSQMTSAMNTTAGVGGQAALETMMSSMMNLMYYWDLEDETNPTKMNEQFKAYLNSDAAVSDLNGYIAAMNMINSNADSIGKASLVNDGFGNSDLQSLVAAALNY